MATSPVPPITAPPGYTMETPATPDASTAGTPDAPNGGVTPPPGYTLGDTPDPTDPSLTGEITNDVGNKVIVPRAGENFGDTIQRAIAHQRSLTPQQQQEAVDREMGTAPKKAGEALGAAAGIGFLGPALMAAPGEALLQTHAALSAGIKALLPALTTGTVAVGQWAEAHPVAAKAILETLKVAVKGTAIGVGAKIAGKVIDSAP
jgi:hypothetical protein